MIRFEVVTLGGVKFAEEVFEIQVPTPEGIIGIFSNHMPLVSLAVPGVITIRRHERDSDDKLEYFATTGGVIEIADKSVRILADEAESSEEINEAAAEKALENAGEALKNATDRVSLEQAQAAIDRQRVRLNVAGLKRRRR